MYKFAREKFSDVQEELQEHIHNHYEEVAGWKDKVKLNPDYDSYNTLSDAGILQVYTARCEGVLVGYNIMITHTNLHYSDHLYAVNDIIYVAPEHRVKGLGGELIKYSEEELSLEGVSVIIMNTKVKAPFDNLLENMDYKLVERSYGKFIGVSE